MKEKISGILFLSVIILISCAQENEESDEINTSNIVRNGSIIRLKPEYEERYIILHKHTFPGVLNRIRKCNIRNYSIFLKDGLLFSHFEYVGSDFDADMAANADDTTKDWWRLTDPMQEPLENRKEGEWWASMDLLFQMQTSKTSYENARRFAYTGFWEGTQSENIKEKINQIDESLIMNIWDVNIQNVTIYQKDSQVFLYYEYVGNNFKKDMEQLQKVENIQSLNLGLTRMMKQTSDGFINRTWHEMTEVFHTN